MHLDNPCVESLAHLVPLAENATAEQNKDVPSGMPSMCEVVACAECVSAEQTFGKFDKQQVVETDYQ